MHHISRLLTTNWRAPTEKSRTILDSHVAALLGMTIVCVCVRHCEAWYKPWQSLARRGTIRCHAERSRNISSLATRYEHRLLSASRRFFVTLRMTFKVSLLHDEALYDVKLSEVEASPRWLHAMNIVSCRPCTKKASTPQGQRSYKWCLLNHIEVRVVI